MQVERIRCIPSNPKVINKKSNSFIFFIIWIILQGSNLEVGVKIQDQLNVSWKYDSPLSGIIETISNSSIFNRLEEN